MQNPNRGASHLTDATSAAFLFSFCLYIFHSAFFILHFHFLPSDPQPCRQRLTKIPDGITLLPIARVLDGVGQIGWRA